MQVLRDCCFDYMKTGFFFSLSRYVCIYSALSHTFFVRICEALGWTLRIHSVYSYTHFCIWKHTEKTWMQHNESSSERISKSKFCGQEQMQTIAYILFSLQFVTLVGFVGPGFFCCCCFLNRTIPLLIINFGREWKRIVFSYDQDKTTSLLPLRLCVRRWTNYVISLYGSCSHQPTLYVYGRYSIRQRECIHYPNL